MPTDCGCQEINVCFERQEHELIRRTQKTVRLTAINRFQAILPTCLRIGRVERFAIYPHMKLTPRPFLLEKLTGGDFERIRQLHEGS
jgi:hypothetical protein